MMQIKNDYPKEVLVELQGLDDYLCGRITVNKNQQNFDCDVDIIQVETGKIYVHVDRLYKLEDEREAISDSLSRLRRYMSELKRPS